MANDTSTVKPYSREGDKKEQVADMFNNISKTYDLLNRFMTLGIDTIWRKKAIRSLLPLQPQYILDVATGTGDFALESIRILHPKKIIGVDISEGMLDVAREKIEKKDFNSNSRFVWGILKSSRLMRKPLTLSPLLSVYEISKTWNKGCTIFVVYSAPEVKPLCWNFLTLPAFP